ncbi:hypothetical protein CPSG_04915 [Coccidioides posadasii str. Silveira]|nr:hypothetical protein CPSG_04915 [Coccidioides posadasii str. Silveira]
MKELVHGSLEFAIVHPASAITQWQQCLSPLHGISQSATSRLHSEAAVEKCKESDSEMCVLVQTMLMLLIFIHLTSPRQLDKNHLLFQISGSSFDACGRMTALRGGKGPSSAIHQTTVMQKI